MQVTYYLDLFFVKGGTIGVVIWLLSIAAMAVAITCFLRITREKLLPDTVAKEVKAMFDARRFREALTRITENPDLYSDLVRRTFVHGQSGRSAMEKGLIEAAEHRTAGLMRMVEWLNVIGNVAPMLGLLGTVWGMIGAFFQIVAAGSPDPRVLANDIGVALVTTLLGLMVAIPSLFIYAVMRNRVEEITGDAVVSVNELIAETQRPEKRPAPAGVGA